MPDVYYYCPKCEKFVGVPCTPIDRLLPLSSPWRKRESKHCPDCGHPIEERPKEEES